MVEALHASHGIVTNAAGKIGITTKTHYEWLKKDPQYALDCVAASESAIDFVEGELYKLIKDHNPAAIIFYMKTKGRLRGYAENIKVDTTIKDDRIRIEVLTNEKANSVASLN